MMSVKYQVFVSSTYADLVEERQSVSRAILDMGHIPAGMEMFPAADVEQLTYIKKVIDECDYYVLIIGARYGSLDEEGVSFTEREFDYAVETGKTVLAFVHHDIDQIPLGKTDKNDAKRDKLLLFMTKASTGRLIQKWASATELRANAIVSLQKAFSETPQKGWVRADTIASTSAMADIIRYREEIDNLRTQLDQAHSVLTPQFTDAAALDTKVIFTYTYHTGPSTSKRLGSKTLSYLTFLKAVAPALHTPSTEMQAQSALKLALQQRHGVVAYSMYLMSSEVQDALLHLVATRHVKMWAAQTIDKSKNVTAYQLTELGAKTWQESSYVKANK